ncbi:MAG TPA: hypothetical protein VFN37_06585 [Candidatus Baltobacteraceae bacterium]|nr:hypothetical protein [Candidatus Baltobacteraceae bacterium]
MKRAVIFIAAIALAACSGNFGTGTGIPQQGGNLPPMGAGATPMPPMDKNGLPAGQPTASSSPGPVGSATYPIDDAQKGFACPQMLEGYGCMLSFNLPPPTPAPSATPQSAKGKGKPTPSPTPSPTPTPSPAPAPSGSASASPAPKASATPSTITLQAQAPPKDAPKMVHIPANTLDTVALMMVQLTTNADFNLDGWANAQFTLPKADVDGRGFALQLFQVNKHKKSVNYRPIWTFDKSTLNDTTLTFSFKTPKTTIGKGSTYMLVLYGDDKSTAAPSALPSGAPGSALPSTVPSGVPSAAPSVTPAGSPTP